VQKKNIENALAATIQITDFQISLLNQLEAEMGALVLTKGTRKLIKQLNQEFNKFLTHYRNDNILGTTTPIAAAFANPNVDLLWLTLNIKHAHSPRNDKLCLLPDDATGHPHLEKRWIYFLSNHANVLTQNNHKAIRAAISNVLNDSSYGGIQFDSIDYAPQTVFLSDEFDTTGIAVVKYLRLVLGTPPMTKATADPNLSLDPQDGYDFKLDSDPAAEGRSDRS
jgi:hypothetical protein